MRAIDPLVVILGCFAILSWKSRSEIKQPSTQRTGA